MKRRVTPPVVKRCRARVTVTYADGQMDTYQLPLVGRTEPAGSLEHVLLGTIQTPDGTRWIYDALHDREEVDQCLVQVVEDAWDPVVRRADP